MPARNELLLKPQDVSTPFASDAEQFHLLLESVTDYAILFTDKEHRVVTWNAGAERILGWAEAEILGENAQVFFTPEDRESGAYEAEFAKAATAGRADDERWHIRKDGSRFWASGILTALKDGAGGLRGYCKILRDLTERKESEEALRAAHDRHRLVADTLQQSLLMLPPPDVFPGITVKPLYQSASDDALIGGDFFDIFAVDQNQIGLVVGDATGKGIEASTYTAEVKFALRVFLRESLSPAAALRRLNLFLTEKERLDPWHVGGSYVALSVILVNTSEGDLCCAWGGIEPPFVLRGDTGDALEMLECSGPLLGVDAQSEYREQRATLRDGDVLAMSTDGLTEARRGRGRNMELFGYEGLVAAVREEVAKHPSSLGDAGIAVAERARAFAGGTINDDVCLLLARCITQDSPGDQQVNQGNQDDQNNLES
ncbi:MAG: SpoIIE family protein phosphatase [Armatimonadota bacterium]